MSTTHEPVDPASIWECYAASWKEADKDAKLARYQKVLASDCTYTDPLVSVQGYEALLKYMLEFHEQVPGGHFVTEQFIAHHGRSMAKWTMRNGAGEILGDGVSLGEYTDDGRKLKAMTGFFTVPSKDDV